MTFEIKKTALRLKKKPPRNSEDDAPPRIARMMEDHPANKSSEKEGKKRKIDEVYANLEIEEEKGKLKELTLVQQVSKLEEIHENNKKLREICERDGLLPGMDFYDGALNPVYWKMTNDELTICKLSDTVKQSISVKKKKLQLIEQRFENLLAKIYPAEIYDDLTDTNDADNPAPASIDLTDTDDADNLAPASIDLTDKETIEELKKRVTDLDFKLSRLCDRVDRDAETTHFGTEKLSGRVDDLCKSVKDLEEWKNAAHEPKKAPEVQDNRPGSRIQNPLEIYPDRKVWVYSKTQRKPGVVKKVNPKRAIVNMANAEGKMTDYDVPFNLIGLRDE